MENNTSLARGLIENVASDINSCHLIQLNKLKTELDFYDQNVEDIAEIVEVLITNIENCFILIVVSDSLN